MENSESNEQTGDIEEECCCECSGEEELDEEDHPGDGLSDSDEELETFEAVPYCFVLKDIFGNPLNLPPELMANATIDCPPFYKLLDHVIAVLWMFYSPKNGEGLTTSDLHWAIKFLEGLKDNQNKHTPDVEMAIDHLQDALLDLCANVDADELEARLSPRKGGPGVKFESTRLEGADSAAETELANEPSPGYDDFQNRVAGEEETELGNGESPISDARRELLYADQPSIILNDMLGDTDPCRLKNILNASLLPDGGSCTDSQANDNCAVTRDNANDTEQMLEEAVKWKKDQIDEAIRILEKMKTFDSAMQGMTCGSDDKIKAKLEELFK